MENNEKCQRDKIVFFKNWANSINVLPEEFQLETYKALLEYGFSGQMPKGISKITEALLVSFSLSVENGICRSQQQSQNGKKGGNPNFIRGQKNPYYNENDDINEDNPNITEDNPDINQDNPKITQDNPKITQDNPKITQDYPDITQTKSEITQDNPKIEIEKEIEIENNNCLSTNKNNLSYVRACEDREQLKQTIMNGYVSYISYWGSDIHGNEIFRDIMYVMADAILKARKGKLKYRCTRYSEKEIYDKFSKIDVQDLRDIVWQIENNDEIKDISLYTLGALINRADEKG